MASVTTVAASSVATNSAILNGSEVDCTTVYFEYGRSATNLNNTTPAIAATATFHMRIGGLTPGVTHYFRAVGDSGAATGSVLSFTTESSTTTEDTTKKPGYQWIDGTYYHYIDSSGVERRAEGTATGATGKSGYIWWDDIYLYYTDQTAGAVRRLIAANYRPEGFTYTFEFWFDGEI